MKRLIVILSIVVTILLLTNCEKDVNEIPVKYYKNVIGEGYIYYKDNDGNITPYTFFEGLPWLGDPWVRIYASENPSDIYIDNYSHTDYVRIENNGRYTFRFLEKKRPNIWVWGEWKKMSFYTISSGDFNNNVTITAETVQEAAKKATKKNPQIISIDTIWEPWFR